MAHDGVLIGYARTSTLEQQAGLDAPRPQSCGLQEALQRAGLVRCRPSEAQRRTGLREGRGHAGRYEAGPAGMLCSALAGTGGHPGG